ncbi:MAG: hypothetical protein KAR79_02820, partial [Simkaniaceae bacterium]|nr:hypothetical protein [Simkaniaceae bacterium]
MLNKILDFFLQLQAKKTPRVIQMEAVECGAATLSMILGYYGKFVSLEELRVMCGVSRDGVSAYNIAEAGKRYGLEVEGVEIESGNLEELKLPVILFWDQNHFIVLETLKNKKAYINDPATGPRWINNEELEKKFSRLAIECSPSDQFQKGGEELRLFPR